MAGDELIGHDDVLHHRELELGLHGDAATVGEREVRDRDGRWHSLRVRPYTTTDNQIDGAMITLEDINALKLSVEQVTAAPERAETIVDSVPVPLVLLDTNLRVTWASRLFYETFVLTPEETITLRNGKRAVEPPCVAEGAHGGAREERRVS